MSAVLMDHTGAFACLSLFITCQIYVTLQLTIFQSESVLDFLRYLMEHFCLYLTENLEDRDSKEPDQGFIMSVVLKSISF